MSLTTAKKKSAETSQFAKKKQNLDVKRNVVGLLRITSRFILEIGICIHPDSDYISVKLTYLQERKFRNNTFFIFIYLLKITLFYFYLFTE